ncbi:ATP-dependent helicase [Acidithiobacillus sp. MC6.1]|nr:ATP-dependent helicase [Acidithiobacillus sp. MC6.1]
MWSPSEEQGMETIGTEEFFTAPLAKPEPAPATRTAETGYAEILASLDADQRAACLEEGHVVVAARPGSGKTRLLVAKTLQGVAVLGPEKVIAITFTRAAAQEMRKRVAQYAGRSVAQQVTISTFHAFALSILKRQVRLRVIDSRDKFLVLIRMLQDQHIHFPVDEMIKALPDFFNKDREVIGLLPGPVVEAMKAYRRYLRENQLTDLDSLVPDLAAMVESGAVRIPAARLLVDEFQDVDPGQARLTIAIGKQGVGTFCVGDDDQSIYGFRRSMGPRAFQAMDKALGSKLVFLQTNYRCRHAIAAAAEQPLLCLSERIQKPLRIQHEGGVVQGWHFDSGDLEMEAASEATGAVAQEGRSVAILARTNHVLDGMEGVLRVAGIAYQRTDSRSFWDMEEVRKCMAFVKLAYQPARHDLYVALHAVPLPYDAIRGVMRYMETLPSRGSLETLVDALYEKNILEGAHVEIVEHFREWRRMFCDWAEHCRDDQQWEALRKVFSEINRKNTKAAMISAATILETVFMRPGRDGKPVPVEERLRWLELPKQDAEGSVCGVQLMTIHASKGLEFDTVWILGARKGILPHQESEDEDEERRILYVGMTRAEKTLIISNSRERVDMPVPPFSFGLELPKADPCG